MDIVLNSNFTRRNGGGKKFFIVFELGIYKNYKPTIKRNNYPEFYYGIWNDPFDPPKCLEKLKTCIENGYKTNEWFARRRNFDKNSPYKFFSPETILKINDNPKELTDIIEPIVVELLDAISKKGL